jgi:hypothetical protein
VPLEPLAICCLKVGRKGEAAEYGEAGLGCRRACRLAPSIAAKAALRAVQACRALGESLRKT